MTEFKEEDLTGNNNIVTVLCFWVKNPRTTRIKFFCFIVVFGHTSMIGEPNCTYKS